MMIFHYFNARFTCDQKVYVAGWFLSYELVAAYFYALLCEQPGFKNSVPTLINDYKILREK